MDVTDTWRCAVKCEAGVADVYHVGILVRECGHQVDEKGKGSFGCKHYQENTLKKDN